MFDGPHTRTVLWAAGSAAALVLLTGCGSSGGASDDAAGRSGPAASTAASPSADAAGGSADDGAMFDTDAHRLITEALDGEKVVECTATDSADTVTTYINGEDHMRIDSGTGPAAGHVVADGAVTYVWSDDQPDGMKVSGEASGAMKSMIQGMGVDVDALRKVADEKGEPLDEGAAIECAEYEGDMSVFDVPDDRAFVSMDEVVSQMPGEMPGTPGAGGAPGGD